MATSPSEYLNRVFPRRFLLRGTALQSLVWTVCGTASLAAVLISAFLLLVLIESQGYVELNSEQAAEFYSLFDDSAGVPQEPLEPGWDATPADAGLRAVAWNLRTRPIGGVAAGVCRFSSRVNGTSAAFLTLLTTGFVSSLLALTFFELARRAAVATAAHTGHQLRESLHRHSLRTGTSDLFDRDVSDVLSLFSVDVESVERWIAGLVTRGSQVPLSLGLLVAIGVMIDWSFIIECGIPLLACWLFILRLRNWSGRRIRLEEDRASTEFRLASEGVHRSRLIRGFLLDGFEHVRFERHLSRYESHVAAAQNLNHRVVCWSAVVGAVTTSVVVYVAAGRVLTLTAYSLSLAEVAFLCGTLSLMAVPLAQLASLLDDRNSARSAIDRVYRFLNSIPEVGQNVGAEFLQPLEKFIEYHDVAYSAGGRNLLDGVSLKLPATGRTVVVAFDRLEAFAFASLLPRFVDPSRGNITIDGHDVSLATLESLRSEVVWAGGVNCWFTGSVVENIAGGDQRFSLSQVTEAAKRTHAHSFIQKFSQGYETVVGEHGEQLSDSQGFRLSLARAVLRDPAVLIIEEPPEVDTEDEKALLEDACRNASKGRTVILLPARMRTLKAADRIVLLNRGQIEVVGTREALLKTSSLYRHWEYLHFNEFRRDVSPSEIG